MGGLQAIDTYVSSNKLDFYPKVMNCFPKATDINIFLCLHSCIPLTKILIIHFIVLLLLWFPQKYQDYFFNNENQSS